MKFKKPAIAAAMSAALVSGSAMALQPGDIDPTAPGADDIIINYAGATAQKETVLTLTSSWCDPATRDVFNRNVTVDPVTGLNVKHGPDHMVVTCNLLKTAPVPAALIPAAGHTYRLYFSYFLDGGSIYGVTPVADRLSIAYMAINPVNGGSCAETAAGSQTWNCENYAANQYMAIPGAGGSDVEPAMFQGQNVRGLTFGAPVNLGDLSVTSAYGVIFAPMLSCDLLDHSVYTSCNGDTYPDSTLIPSGPITSLSKTSLVSIFTQPAKISWEQVPEYGFADTYGNGAGGPNGVPDMEDWWNFNTETDHAIQVARRKPGSGTQAFAQAYYGKQECGNNPFRSFVQATDDPARIVEVSSSTDIAKINMENTKFAIGLGGTEKANDRADDKYGHRWDFVKINGVQATDQNAALGNWDDYSENSMQYNKLTMPAGSREQVFISNLFSYAQQASSLPAEGALAIPNVAGNIPGDPADGWDATINAAGSDGITVAQWSPLNRVAWVTRNGQACKPLTNVFP